MNYTIIEYNQADPDVDWLDPELPSTCDPNPVVNNPNWDNYSVDSVNRSNLYIDTAGTATDTEILTTFPWIRDELANSIRAKGAEVLDVVAKPYTPSERETWFIQNSEADSYLLDNTVATPMLTALATERGITVPTLVGLVKGNFDLFTVACGEVVGKQQKYLTELYDTNTTVDRMIELSTWPSV